MTGPAPTADQILELYRSRGTMEYEGEGVSQLAHAAQCGALAREAGATPELQLAAWLHDIGHLLAGLAGTPTLEGIDDRHEVRGAAYLSEAFGPAVADPVALHVPAKRYLVSSNADYYQRLSADSRRSLELQGGPMTAEEQRLFMQRPFARDALRVRAWDDAAKRAGCTAGGLAELEQVLREVLDRGGQASRTIHKFCG